MAQNLLALSLIAILVISVGVNAKRGCSAFGHSCFGGHGKRSENSQASGSEILSGRQLGQEETPPHPVYPHSGYGILPSGDDIIPIRDGGVYERDENPRDVMKMKLRNIVKNWMENFRRSQQNEDGVYIETL
ncbi:neuropeptide CCHamide-2 [Pieris rapae]|uniref:neuropeptide CCHamide-2 n=1 Tax=Pieris rapae TaxID=64459 RepID=UPI001E27DD31|nr:neuropeptide CCHamide-2 [Pieris rapae]